MKKLFVLFTLTSSLLVAITLTPMTETLESKKQKNIIFKVSNTSSEPVAVDFSILKVIGIENNEEQREATNSVQAYPTTFVLSSKETKSVRVRYMNKKLPQKEEIYRILAKELDIDVSDENDENTNGKVKANIKMRFSYEGLLFVHDEKAKGELQINSIEKSTKGIKIAIANTGKASAIPLLGKYDFIATVDDKEYTLTKNDISEVFSRILAGKTNTFHLKNITSVPVAKITSIRLEKK